MDYPKMIAPGVAVIGRFEPSLFDARLIGYELLEATRHFQIDGFGTWTGSTWYDHYTTAEVREPKVSASLSKHGGPDPALAPWHRDRIGNENTCMVIWSNQEQTEIKLPDGTELKPNPGDILIIDNEHVMHRTPVQVSENRWFFRRYVKTPSWMEIAK